MWWVVEGTDLVEPERIVLTFTSAVTSLLARLDTPSGSEFDLWSDIRELCRLSRDLDIDQISEGSFGVFRGASKHIVNQRVREERMTIRDETDHTFRCRSCGFRVHPSERPVCCPECSRRLEVTLDSFPDSLPGNDARSDLLRYVEFLPTAGITPLSCGEGWTPLVDAPALADTATSEAMSSDNDEPPEVLVKNETTNPTWSWKDRLASMVVPHAIAGGARRIVTATSGNQGSAIAAYAAKGDVDEVLVFVSPSSEPPHHRQIRAYGAQSVRLSDYSERKRLLRALADNGWFVAYPLADHYCGQPYVYEGYKTIAFEIVEQHGIPDAVIVPVGSGDGLYGIWKGFRDLYEADIVDERPRMVSAESEERKPLAKAFWNGAESVGTDEGPVPLSTSTMGTTSGDHALEAIERSGGCAVAVDEAALSRATNVCGRDGVFLEPASALAAAAVWKITEADFWSQLDSVVVVGTGSGIAWPEKTAQLVGRPPTVEPNLSALADAVPYSLE